MQRWHRERSRQFVENPRVLTHIQVNTGVIRTMYQDLNSLDKNGNKVDEDGSKFSAVLHVEQQRQVDEFIKCGLHRMISCKWCNLD